MPILNAQTVGNAYPTTPGTGASLAQVWNAKGGWFSVASAGAYVKLQYGGLGADHWTDEILLGAGAFVVLPANCIGMQFRNSVSNAVATVTAQIAQGDEPPLSISSIGQTNVVSVASLNFQHGGVAVSTEPTLNFIDAAGVITWTVADDAPNTRVNLTPAFTSPALFPGAVGIGGNAGDTPLTRLAAGVVGSTMFSTGPLSEAVGGSGVAGLVMGTRYNASNASATGFAEVSAVTTDTQGRFARDVSGTMTWGPGGVTVRDLTLGRTGAGILGLGTSAQAGRLDVKTASAAGLAYSSAVTVDANVRFTAAGDGTLSWGPGTAGTDTSLARLATVPPSSGQVGLFTPQAFYSTNTTGGFVYAAATNNAAFLSFLAAADANPAFKMFTQGALAWGAGGASALDLELARQVNLPSGTGTFLELLIGAGFGYGTGTGGTVTQTISLSTGVTLSKPSGTITLFTTAWANGGVGNFVLTNTTIGAMDTVHVSFQNTIGGARFVATVTAVAAGSCTIGLWNLDALTASGTAKLNFCVIKGANA